MIGRFSLRAESMFSMIAIVNVMVWSFAKLTKHFYLVRSSNFALARRINSLSKLSFKVFRHSPSLGSVDGVLSVSISSASL